MGFVKWLSVVIGGNRVDREIVVFGVRSYGVEFSWVILGELEVIDF